MFAVYATHAAPNDPLAALMIGELPESVLAEGWVRVKISHASLNRHDLFTLRGISGHPEGIRYPLILGNDGAGTLDDGTPVVILDAQDSTISHTFALVSADLLRRVPGAARTADGPWVAAPST